MGRSVKKGAYVEESLTRRFDKVVAKRSAPADQNLVSPFDDYS